MHLIRDLDKSAEFSVFYRCFWVGTPPDPKVPTAIPHMVPRARCLVQGYPLPHEVPTRTRSAQGFSRPRSWQQRFGEQPRIYAEVEYDHMYIHVYGYILSIAVGRGACVLQTGRLNSHGCWGVARAQCFYCPPGELTGWLADSCG